MSSSPFSNKRFKTAFAAGWLLWVLMHAILLHYGFAMAWFVSFADSIITNLLLLLACFLIINTLRFYLPRHEKYFYIIIWCLFLTALWLLLNNWLLPLLLAKWQYYAGFMKQSLAIRFCTGFLIMGTNALISALWYNWQEQKEQEKRKADTERLTKEAELFKLRQQLQPHFLFNSLNSINALISSRPEEARKMVQQLSEFLRGTLKKEERQWVTLKEELQYLQLYLDIEKVRFGNRLSTVIECEERAGEMQVPALLLQPVVENAIKFGLYDTTGEAVIIIHAEATGKDLKIMVRNPYDPETAQPRQGTGFGLNSVQRRLYLLFARRDLLTTEAKENIFTTTVNIPQYEQSDHY